MSLIGLEFDPSQFPGKQEKEFKQALRQRKFAAKWHYESEKQVSAWLKVHETYSPARTSSEVQNLYQYAFEALAERNPFIEQLVSLGCGGAQKDLLCLQALAQQNRKKLSRYVAVDGGSAMVLSALLKVKKAFPALETRGIVADLIGCKTSSGLIDKKQNSFFLLLGLIPNMEPPLFIKLLRQWVGGKECLISVNLVPDGNYRQELNKILSQYDNLLTKQWLSLLLKDLGFVLDPEEVEMTLKPCPYLSDLWRIEASYKIRKKVKIDFAAKIFSFEKGERLQLFYSYRYTVKRLATWLSSHKISIIKSYVTPSQEEGIFCLR